MYQERTRTTGIRRHAGERGELHVRYQGGVLSQWFVDAGGCVLGFAHPDSSSVMLLRRDEMGNVVPNAPPPMKVEDDDVPAAAAAAVVIPDDVEVVVVVVVIEGSTEGGGGGKLVGAQPLMMGGGGGGGGGGGVGSNNKNKYYPSLDMKKYPNGACPNDGNIPLEYQRDLSSSSSEFIFDSIEKCCVKWFIDVEACIAATGIVLSHLSLGRT